MKTVHLQIQQLNNELKLATLFTFITISIAAVLKDPNTLSASVDCGHKVGMNNDVTAPFFCRFSCSVSHCFMRVLPLSPLFLLKEPKPKLDLVLFNINSWRRSARGKSKSCYLIWTEGWGKVLYLAIRFLLPITFLHIVVCDFCVSHPTKREKRREEKWGV